MGWRIFRTLFFIPNIISYASLSVVYLSFFNARYGLLNTILEDVGLDGLTRDWLFSTDTALAAIIMTWLFQIGLYMLLFMAEIAAIPEQLYEAAEIDGATEFQKDFLITIPLLRNIIGTAMILAATQSLIYFEGILLMTEGGPANATLNLPMFAYRNYSNFNWGYTNAIGVIILIFGIVLIVSIRQLFRVGRRDA
jgi:raffinose/stachyose/melibiose transport system permease protein